MPENLAETNSENSIQTATENSTSEETSFSSAADRIQRAPSPENWKAELDSILENRRDDDIDHLGSVSQHIRVIISGANSPQLAEDAFRSALNYLLNKWQPLVPEEPACLYYILSLIQGFTPKTGFVKLAGYLKNDNRFHGTYTTPMGWEISFQSLALSALKAFYPAAPPFASEDRAYQTYVDILRLNMEYADYFGSCAARLIDLKELSYDSPEILERMTRHRKGLDEIIRQIFYPYKPDTAGTNLGYLYAHCKKNNLSADFEKCVKPYGKIVEHPVMQVTHEEGRVDLHHHPGVYFVHKNMSLEIALTEDDTYKFHEQINSDMAKLKRLIEDYRSSRGASKKDFVKEIAEELSAIMDKAVRSKELDIKDVEGVLKRLGGELSNDKDNFTLLLDKKKIPFKIASAAAVYFAMRNVEVTKKSLMQLTDMPEAGFKQHPLPQSGVRSH